jgi:hypothetical protein
MRGEEHVLHEVAPDTTKGARAPPPLPRPTATEMKCKTNIVEVTSTRSREDPIAKRQVKSILNLSEIQYVLSRGFVDEPRHLPTIIHATAAFTVHPGAPPN